MMRVDYKKERDQGCGSDIAFILRVSIRVSAYIPPRFYCTEQQCADKKEAEQQQ